MSSRHIVTVTLLILATALANVHPAVVQAQQWSKPGQTALANAPQLSTLNELAPQWSTLGRLSSARSNVGAVYIGYGKILVIGGSTGIPLDNDPRAIPQSTCEIIDVWQHRIMPAASLNIPRSEFAALQTRDSNVIVIGGVIGIDPISIRAMAPRSSARR